MQNSNLPMVPTSVDAFVNTMAEIESEGGVSRPRPDRIKLDGNSGTYNLRKWNQETKQPDLVPFQGGKEWQGTILLTRWFVKWKHKENEKTRRVFRTNEFISWGSPIELFEIDYEKSSGDKAKSIGKYDGYKALKEAHAIKSTVSDLVTYPFDLWVSLYIYVLETDSVVNFQTKGTTRSNYFDYLQEYRNGFETLPLKSKVEVKTLLSSESHEMPATKEEQAHIYFSGTFKTVGVNTPEEMRKIQQATIDLVSWIKSNEGQVDSDLEEKPEPTSVLVQKPNANTDEQAKLMIMDLVNRIGVMPKTVDEWKASVRMLTGMDLEPANYQPIITKLERMVSDHEENAVKLEDIPF